MTPRLLAVVLVIGMASNLRGDDWPQFRGPTRDGISKETGLAKEWPKDGPKLLWTFENAGLGHSSFAIVKDVLFTLGTDFDAKNPKDSARDEYVIAIDAKSGKEKWRIKLSSLYAPKGGTYGDGPRSTPTIDGNMLYALSGAGDLVCFDISAQPKEVWRKNLPKDFDGALMTGYGFSESPLIDGEHLICTPGGAGGTLAALNKKTGALVWRSKAWTDAASYASVIAADIQGVRQYLQIGYEPAKTIGSVAGVEAKTGNVLWNSPIFSGANDGTSTSPIVNGNQVYVSAAWGGGCHLFEIDKKQNAKDLYNKKAQKRVKSTFGGLVLVDGHIYGHTEPGSWICQELKSGDEKWLERNELKCSSGAIIAVDGKLFVYTDDGEAAMLAVSPDEFKVISTLKIPKRSTMPADRVSSRMSRVWAHPVIANGVLYLRDHEYIFAFDILGGQKKAERAVAGPEYVVLGSTPSCQSIPLTRKLLPLRRP